MPTWADAAVRVASNLTDTQALKLNVIDLVAPTLPALLAEDQRPPHEGRDARLHASHGGRHDHELEPGILHALPLDPDRPERSSTLLFLAGLAGLAFEIFHPGIVLPGAIGAICMLTALFGFSVLPISWTGFALVLLGVGLLAADVHVQSHGALTVSGLLASGSASPPLPQRARPVPHVDPADRSFTAAVGGFWAFALSKALAARRQPVTVGPEEIVGMEGIVHEGGFVLVHGELWHADACGRAAQAGRAGAGRPPRRGLILDVRHRDVRLEGLP